MSLANKNILPRTALHYLAPAAITAASLFSSGVASAASLQQVSGWEQGGEPGNISMYAYVADNLSANPPILVLLHYCGSNANGVFGQSSGMKALADEKGFILVVPSTTLGCWDVATDAALTNGGGGHTGAIVNMVEYAVSEYGGNADRVYAVGTSGGAMAMQGLLAVYPEVFKAGSGFSGVPAGCWAVDNADGSWSSPCANGTVTHTGQEWGDIVRDMYAGYDGIRPRVQIYHGDGDPTISFTNHTEAVKQWVNVMGLTDEPTDTSSVNIGGTNFNREEWKDECGTTLLDVLTEPGGPHNTSANMNAQEVLPFLSLDIDGADDPYAASDCAPSGDGGMGSGGSDAGVGGSDAGDGGGDAGDGGSDAGGSDAGGSDAGGSDAGAGGSDTAAGGSDAAAGSGVGGAGTMAGGTAGIAAGGTAAPGAGGTAGQQVNVTNNTNVEESSGGCSWDSRNSSRPVHGLTLAGLFVAMFARRRYKRSARVS